MSSAAEFIGGRAARDTEVPSASDDEAALLAAKLLPHSYYVSGEAQARLEIFRRRGRLTRELTAIGLPPVYEHAKGVLVGKQVDTADPATGSAPGGSRPQRPSEPPWRLIRQRALNPAHNPVMARNIRLKAQLAQYAARGAAAVAQARPSARVLRYNAAMAEAERTTAKLQVVTGGEARRMRSAPISKPYHARRLKGGVPANEREGGDLLPGKVSRLVAKQIEAEEARAGKEAAAPVLSAAERERQEQIQALADVIVAAPQLGIRHVGAYLPRELAPRQAHGPQHPSGAQAALSPPLPRDGSGGSLDGQRRQRPTASATAPEGDGVGGLDGMTGSGNQDSASGSDPAAGRWDGRFRDGPHGDAVAYAAGLAEALQQLELSAAAGRAAVGAAEDDYGAHYRYAAPPSGGAPGGSGAAGEGLEKEDEEQGAGAGELGGGADGSPAASSYGSGGHYLYEEGMAEESDGDDGGGDRGSEPGSLAGGSTEDGSSQQPKQTSVLNNPVNGIQVILYPAATAADRRRQAKAAGVQAVADQASAARAVAPSLPYDPDVMRRWDARLPNEAAGGRVRRGRDSAAMGRPDPSPEASEFALEPAAAAVATVAASRGSLQGGPQDPPAATHEASAQLEARSVDGRAAPLPSPAPQMPTHVAAAMLQIPNEVRHTGRVRLRDQPETAGMDTSGRWTEAAVAAGRPAAGGRSKRKSGRAADGAGAGSRLADPVWRRESHAERAEALVAAAEARAQAAAEEETVRQAATARPRVAARIGGAGRPRAAPALGPASGESVPAAADSQVAAEGSGAPQRSGSGGDVAPSMDRFALLSDAEELTEEEEELEWGQGPAGVYATETAELRLPVETGAAVAASGYPESADAEDAGVGASNSNASADVAYGAITAAGGLAAGAGFEAHAGGQAGLLTASKEEEDEEERGQGQAKTRLRVARVELGDSSSDEEGDPWGIDDADELGYPLNFRQAAAAQDSVRRTVDRSSRSATAGDGGMAAAAAASPTVSDRGNREERQDRPAKQRTRLSGPNPHRGTRGPRAAGGADDGDLDGAGSEAAWAERAGTAGAAAASTTGSRSQMGLLEVFGLSRATEVIVDPRDIPPIELTPPPDWLVGTSGSRVSDTRATLGHTGGDPQAGRGGGTGSTGSQGGAAEKHQVAGRVEAALARAELNGRRPQRTVQHDRLTFYFTEHP